ncbi:hypothetical protein Bca101_032904 [Brassica carinata]
MERDGPTSLKILPTSLYIKSTKIRRNIILTSKPELRKGKQTKRGYGKRERRFDSILYLTYGEKADDEEDSDADDREEQEESDGDNPEAETDEEEITEEVHREEEGGVQSQDESDILAEGEPDPRFGNFFESVETETPTLLFEAPPAVNIDDDEAADSEVDGCINPPKRRKTSLSQPSNQQSTPNQSQASTQPASTAPQPTTRIQSQPPPSTVPTGRGRGRRGRPPGRGQSRKVTVPRGVGVYMCPFSDRVFECFGTSREVGGSSSHGPKPRK